MSADRTGIRVTWNVAMWIIGIVFGAGVIFSTLNERAYIDTRFATIDKSQASTNTKMNLLLIKAGIDPKQLDASGGKGE
jgi:hypothetical protein